MPRPFQQYVPQDIGEIMDHLGMIMLSSPTFKDDYFVEQNVNTVFSALNQGILLIKTQLGDDRYQELLVLSDKMRRHFEADPEDKTGDSAVGRAIVHEMKDVLKGVGKGKVIDSR